MTKIHIKDVKYIKDVKPFLNIVYNNFKDLSNDPTLGHNYEELYRLLTDNNFRGLFAYNESGKIIGYLIGETKHLNDGRLVFYISYIYVCSKHQGNKLGSRLLEIIISKMKGIGMKFIVLTYDKNNDRLRKFYYKYGFVKDPVLNHSSTNEVVILYL